MTRPSDDAPTTVIPQQTAEQPAVTTAPSTTRQAGLWSHVPARIGRARTSTVVIGCLFVLGLALNAGLPRDENETVPVTTSDGRTIEVPRSALPEDYLPPTPTPTPTAPGPTSVPAPTSTPAATSQAPQSSDGEDEEPAPTPTTRPQGTSSTPTSARPTSTSRAPATGAEPPAEEEEEPAATPSAPTG